MRLPKTKAIIVALLMLSQFSFLSAQTQNIIYQPNPNIITNPGRGFYDYTASFASNPDPLTLTFLNDVKTQNQITLIKRYYYLDAFYNSPISDSFLATIEQDFETIRQAGFKVALRFAYTEVLLNPPLPPYNDTPAKALVFDHIDQIGPIIRDNADVILTMHNGFYGTFGENFYSDEFGTIANGSTLTAQNWADRKQVTDMLLGYLPESTLLSVRYPTLKAIPYGFTMPDDSLTAAEAHNGSFKSRIGYHNDCFLADANDFTFQNTAIEKPYWQTEAKYTIMGGETCNDNAIYSNCGNALSEMADAHWTYINSEFHPDALQRWQDEGCYTEIQRRLGYRLVLKEGTFDELIQTGGTLNFSLVVENEGFAAPVGHNQVILVLRNQDQTYEFPLSSDPRMWYGGEEITIQEQINLPDNIAPGAYELLLKLPDQSSNLADNPLYALQLANQGTWIAMEGLNNLNATIRIEAPRAVSLPALESILHRFLIGLLILGIVSAAILKLQ